MAVARYSAWFEISLAVFHDRLTRLLPRAKAIKGTILQTANQLGFGSPAREVENTRGRHRGKTQCACAGKKFARILFFKLAPVDRAACGEAKRPIQQRNSRFLAWMEAGSASSSASSSRCDGRTSGPWCLPRRSHCNRVVSPGAWSGTKTAKRFDSNDSTISTQHVIHIHLLACTFARLRTRTHVRSPIRSLKSATQLFTHLRTHQPCNHPYTTSRAPSGTAEFFSEEANTNVWVRFCFSPGEILKFEFLKWLEMYPKFSKCHVFAGVSSSGMGMFIKEIKGLLANKKN